MSGLPQTNELNPDQAFFILRIGNWLHLCVKAFSTHVLLTDVFSPLKSIDAVNIPL